MVIQTRNVAFADKQKYWLARLILAIGDGSKAYSLKSHCQSLPTEHAHEVSCPLEMVDRQNWALKSSNVIHESLVGLSFTAVLISLARRETSAHIALQHNTTQRRSVHHAVKIVVHPFPYSFEKKPICYIHVLVSV